MIALKPQHCPRLTNEMMAMNRRKETTLNPLPAASNPQAASLVGKRGANKKSRFPSRRREDHGGPLEMVVSAPSATVQNQSQEPDEHVIWMDTIGGAVFMIVSPKYCGEISGLEHAWEKLRSHVQSTTDGETQRRGDTEG
jgi:hypothetical protein